MRQTSLDAHQDIQTDGTAESQRMHILRHIRSFPEGLIRAEISEQLNIPINAVCGRVKELLKVGSVYEDEKRMNPQTRKMNYVVKPSKIVTYEQ